MSWKTVLAAAILGLGAATARVNAHDGMAKAAFACEPGAMPFGRFCLSKPRYYDDFAPDAYYDYVPPDASGAADTSPECQHSEELVRVPSGHGGSRLIRIIRCP